MSEDKKWDGCWENLDGWSDGSLWDKCIRPEPE